MGMQATAGGRIILLLLLLLRGVWVDDDSKPKEIEMVITGTKSSELVGELMAPPTFPDEPYTLDATTYIFVLENMMIEGAVQVMVENFTIHPKSWLTVRNSKYGGYIGQVLGRYDRFYDPPSVILTDTCCLRLEFHTGCCGSSDHSYTGFRATYKFVKLSGRGRRSDCRHDRVYTQLCNGECIPPTWDCPCPLYGQYKCDNGVCVDPDKVCDGQDHCDDHSDETFCDSQNGHRKRPAGLGVMYTFSVIITTVCSLLAFVCVMICLLCSAERIMKRLKTGTPDVEDSRECDPPKVPQYSYIARIPDDANAEGTIWDADLGLLETESVDN